MTNCEEERNDKIKQNKLKKWEINEKTNSWLI